MFLYWIRYMSRVKRLEILAKQKKNKNKKCAKCHQSLVTSPTILYKDDLGYEYYNLKRSWF
jgi:hypothetical protein